MVLSCAGSGHSGHPGAGAVPERLWLAAELPLVSSNLTGSWEKCVWVFARWSLSVCPFLWPLFALLVFTGLG